MRQLGLDTSQDDVYPDLAFAIPVPPYEPGDPQTVGVGVMDYHGTNDDREQAERTPCLLFGKMKFFVHWLVDSGRKVRLFVGDTNGSDDSVVQEIVADLRESTARSRPGVGRRRAPFYLRRPHAGNAGGRQRGRDALSQRGVCAQALQAYRFDRLCCEERRLDGGYGAGRVLPVQHARWTSDN